METQSIQGNQRTCSPLDSRVVLALDPSELIFCAYLALKYKTQPTFLQLSLRAGTYMSPRASTYQSGQDEDLNC